MGRSYTELFFLDEATALAAGHRPCFECRRADARAFAAAWAAAEGRATPPRAAEIDAILHAERLTPAQGRRRRKRVARIRLQTAPAGAMVSLWGAAWLVGESHLFRWSFAGYDQAIQRFDAEVALLTPPSVAAALAAGYAPQIAAPL